MVLGLSRAGLGERVGVTFQQIQKYEKGSNRASASRLYEFAETLGVPISYFFDEMPETVAKPVGAAANSFSDHGQAPFPLIHGHTSRVVSAYCQIRDESVQRCLLALMRVIGSDGE